MINSELAAFLIDLAMPLDADLDGLYRESAAQGLPIIDRDVVNFIQVLFKLRQPLNVLEIGCCVGFSALLMARMIGQGGKVTTIDRYPLMIERARENFTKYDTLGQIELLEGDAAEILPQLSKEEKQYDLIFLDAGKGQYNRLWEYCYDLMANGGVFLADDVLQGGSVAWEIDKIEKRQRTTHRNLNEFLRTIMNANDLVSTILPIGDGLLVGVKEQK